MRIDSEFTVKAPIEVVWSFLLDVERIAPCMPGAQLTEVVDDHTWKGKNSIKVGTVSLSFAGTVELKERDDSAHRAVLKAQGMEQKGKGAASASVVTYLQDVDGGTKVVMETDLTISGAVAQYGRGMIQDISQRLTQEFARCLETNLTAEGVAAASAQPEPVAAVAKPVKGLRLGVWAFWRAVLRFFKRLFGQREA
jgi:carbon monoxide dehydrogenase subunit G